MQSDEKQASRPTGPLQNRVLPTGEICALPQHGLFMGNRGGKIHDPATRQLTARRWASKRWISCVTEFKGRRRHVMGAGYTELFFLDEVTALSAGHRPCFECRRHAATRFAALFGEGNDFTDTPSADDMDTQLHTERLDGKTQRRHTALAMNLPEATFVLHRGRPFALKDHLWLAWTANGYTVLQDAPEPDEQVQVLTPDCIVKTLKAGYKPVWHDSAESCTHPPSSEQAE